MPLRLLIAYDGSDAAADAIRAAASLFARAHARATFVRAPTIGIDDVALARVAVPDSVIAAGAAEHERAARARAEELLERGRLTAERAGLQAAARGSALIVAGGRGRGALASTLLGSVSAGLAQNAELPVLIVR
jgi:nucleotide-binding universal stress UspA family protein